MFYNQQSNCVFLDFIAICDVALDRSITHIVELGLVDTEELCINLKDPNIKNILYHNIILHTCESILNCGVNGYKVIYCLDAISFKNTTNFDIDQTVLNKLLKKIVCDMKKLLPVVFYGKSKMSFEDFVDCLNKGSGEARECINEVITLVNDFDQTSYRFDKLYKYTKKHNLNFLSHQYFDQLNTKRLLYQR